MVSSRLSPNTDNKPAVGRKLALIAMVVVLSKIWPQRRCALAVNRWFNGCRRHGGVLRCGRDDRLEVELQPVLNLCGDSLNIFGIWYNATNSVAADDYLRTHRPAATRSRLINGGCFGFPFCRFRDRYRAPRVAPRRRDGSYRAAGLDLLVHLVRNRDRIVSKDELIDAIWQGRISWGAALSSRISAARRALGDSGNVQSFIRPLHKRGFPFVGDVDEAGSAPAAGAGDHPPSPPAAAHEAAKLVPDAEPLLLPDKP